MAQDFASELPEIVEREAARLLQISDGTASVKPFPAAWSKKEELGHLIDSAANNQARFVAASLQPEFRAPGYDQDGWVHRHGYNEMPWAEIVDFWRRYNHVLAALVRRIPEDRLETPCFIGDGPQVTLGFLVHDYLRHLRHHLDHILK